MWGADIYRNSTGRVFSKSYSYAELIELAGGILSKAATIAIIITSVHNGQITTAASDVIAKEIVKAAAEIAKNSKWANLHGLSVQFEERIRVTYRGGKSYEIPMNYVRGVYSY